MVGGVHGAHLPILSGIRDQGAGHAKSDKLVYCHEALPTRRCTSVRDKAQDAGTRRRWRSGLGLRLKSDDEADLAV